MAVNCPRDSTMVVDALAHDTMPGRHPARATGSAGASTLDDRPDAGPYRL